MFLPPLMSRKYKGTYLQKMEQIDGKSEKDSNPFEGSLLDSAINYIGNNAFITIVYCH